MNQMPFVHLGLQTICCHKKVFDDDFHMLDKEIDVFLEFDSLCDFSLLFFEFYSKQNRAIVDQCNYIIEYNVITDDSHMQDIMLYHQAYLFIFLHKESYEYQELINSLILLGENVDRSIKHPPQDSLQAMFQKMKI